MAKIKPNSTESPSVVFVDHSSEQGGAEFALVRLLKTTQPWRPILVVPAATTAHADAFADVPHDVRSLRIGPRHSARITSGTGAVASAALAWRILRSAFSLVRAHDVRNADVIVANTTRASVYVALAGAVLRKPVVVHIRDLVEPAAIGSTASTLMRRFVLPRAAGIIANSRASLALVSPYLRTGCVKSVVPSPSGLVAAKPDEVSVKPAVSRIGMVARLDPWKGQELLVRAFAAGCADTDAHLVLFGGAAFGHDEFPAALRQVAVELGVGDRLDMPGHVSDVPTAISSLDVCVQSSLRPEPLGQNVLQYLAAGKPTVVANEGGPAEWVENDVNGLTFTARDVESLAAALRRLCTDAPLRDKLAHAAAATPGLLTDDEVGAQVADVVRKVRSR